MFHLAEEIHFLIQICLHGPFPNSCPPTEAKSQITWGNPSLPHPWSFWSLNAAGGNISLLIKWTIWQRGGVQAGCLRAALLTSRWFKVSQRQRARTWWQGWRLRPVTSNKSLSAHHRKSIDHPAHFKGVAAWLTKWMKTNKMGTGGFGRIYN